MFKFRQIIAVAMALGLKACAGASTLPLSQDTFQVSGGAAPICGSAGAQRVALRHAAVETIRRGKDRFIILGAQGGSEVVGLTPVTVHNMGGGFVTASGGDPIRSSRQGLVVRTFADGDPAAATALSARQVLGPKWKELASKDQLTCFE